MTVEYLKSISEGEQRAWRAAFVGVAYVARSNRYVLGRWWGSTVEPDTRPRTYLSQCDWRLSLPTLQLLLGLRARNGAPTKTHVTPCSLAHFFWCDVADGRYCATSSHRWSSSFCLILLDNPVHDTTNRIPAFFFIFFFCYFKNPRKCDG
jgi:hypothetical protein